MQTQPVHWHEGMFLRPQHFQLATRYSVAVSDRGDKWDQHYNWGLRNLEIDLDALSNFRFVVRSLEARYRDGTQVAVPEDLVLPAFDLKPALSNSGSIQIYLALPLLQSNRSNVGESPNESLARFVIDTQNLQDENTGINPQPVKVRRLNIKLLTSDQNNSGYELLPLAKLMRADRAEAVPQLDESFIPPLLSCDAWRPLRQSIMEPIYDRIGKKLEFLSGQIVSRNINFDSQRQGDRLLFEELRVMNEAYIPLGVSLFAKNQHPLDMYLQLGRIVGKLAIFSKQRRLPPLPQYDHDDLASCFWRAKQHIDSCLDVVVEPDYFERALVGAGMRMQVALEPNWLESGKKMFVGVQSSLTADECERLLTTGLDMKIGSSTRVDEIFRTGSAGLQFEYCNHPPRSLPNQPGLMYFEINRGSQADEWLAVQKSLTLAIRLNENLIASNIQGERSLTIQLAGMSTNLNFTLYVTPEAI
jgi:type VI secretion system protein ImpJ